MKNNPIIYNRRSIRLQGYDYTRAGAYFVTVCAQNRECLFGEIANGQLSLNGAGRMIQTAWDDLPVRFHHIELDEFIVMPNHIHGIVIFARRRGEPCVRPSIVRPRGTLPDTVGRMVQAFKSITTHDYSIGVKQFGWPPFPGKLWQRNYWERIIRNESELNRIHEYIRNNPAQWELDKLHPRMGANGVGEPEPAYTTANWMA